MRSIEVHIYQVDGARMWPYFRQHHYLTGGYNGRRAFVATLPDGTLVGFVCSIPFPHGTIKRAWRGHRFVVLPDFQGLGIGVRLGEWLAEWHRQQGHRFFVRATHPRIGARYACRPCWRVTSSSQRHQQQTTSRKSVLQGPESAWHVDESRVCYSIEYLGRGEPVVFREPMGGVLRERQLSFLEDV